LTCRLIFHVTGCLVDIIVAASVAALTARAIVHGALPRFRAPTAQAWPLDA